jgi:hypothetical protein
MASAPPRYIIDAIEDGVVAITRRMEVYEEDGTTLWYASSEEDPLTKRLIDGSITVDYNSAERRKGDLTLLNHDFAFRLNPSGGFYYDKIIKLYRGVEFNPSLIQPKIGLVETDLTGNTLDGALRVISRSGYMVDNISTATGYGDIADYDIVMALNQTTPLNKHLLFKEAHARGKHVFTISIDATNNEIPYYGGGGSFTGNWGIQPSVNDSPLRNLITTSGNIVSDTGWHTDTPANGGIAVAMNSQSPSWIAVIMGLNKVGSYWFQYQMNAAVLANQETHNVNFLTGVLKYLATGGLTSDTWEVQLGEFMIDGVNDQIFPNQVKVNFRDYTKKLLKDKIAQTSTFVAGTPLRTFVRSIAANGGITKFREAIGDEIFPNDITYDRKTDRWKMITDACTAFDYEVFFDNEGYLVVRKFNDPTTAPIYQSFGTGATGNLVSFDRSINDGRIFNIARVYGDPISNDRLPYFGEAINDDPASPTSIMELGRRPWEFEGNYFTSDQQCLDLARSRLKILGLESYDINFSSIYYPWLEVGEIVEILDPHRNSTDPTRFLMDQITLPIKLGPMSGTGKRVTLVGNSG